MVPGLQNFCESVYLDRCNTVITECTGGVPRLQLLGRDNSAALAWRRFRNRGSQSLRASHMSARSSCVNIVPMPLR
eukprot:6174151-Amphidinium_carterae.1